MFRLFVSEGDYKTKEEAIEAGAVYEQDGESTIIKEWIEVLQDKAAGMTDDELIKRSEELRDLLTPNGNGSDLMEELIEVERELTTREGK